METGGAQRVLLDQAAWFHQQGYRVTAAFLYDKEGLQQRWQAKLPVPLVNLQARRPGAGGARNLLALAGGTARLWRLLRAERFDALETFTHHSNLIGLPLAWLAGVPRRIASHHGHILGFPTWLERVHAWLINSSLTSRLVAVSRQVRQVAIREGIRPEQIVVIPNGVNLPCPDPLAGRRLCEEVGISENDRIVLAAGRMTYQKAHTFLIQAASEVLREHPSTVFVLLGDGPLRAELEEEGRRLGIERQIRFLGIRQDVLDWMAAADIFVLPSRWEGLPMVLLEAMGMGAAVVATAVEGVEEVIQDRQNGWLVPPEDPDALARAILWLLNHETERSQLAAAGRELVQREYTVERMCRAYAELFDLALQGTRGEKAGDMAGVKIR